MRQRMTALRNWLERLLLWRVWERMLEIEFVDRSVALAGKAFVSFFPLVIVVAAFVPESIRSLMIDTLTARLGIQGDALAITRQALASSEDIRTATGLLGLVLTIFFANSFTTALRRVYQRAWRRPPHGGIAGYWRGAICLLAVLVNMALLGALPDAPGGGLGIAFLAILSLGVSFGLWWFISWFLLLGEVRARVLIPTAVITSLATAGYAASATIWMPKLVTSNETQFGFIGVALALVTWFSGFAICVLVGACAGTVFAEDDGRLGALIRGDEPGLLNAGAPPALPPPVRELSFRDAFQSTDDS